nr:ComEC/Rec2 family competence protein [Nocardioides perillae]
MRVPAVALAGWAGGLAAHLVPAPRPAAVPAGLLVVACVTALVVRRRACAGLVAACLVAAVAVGAVTALRLERSGTGPVAELAALGAAVDVDLEVTSDARAVTGRYGEVVLVRGTVVAITGRGVRHEVRAPVLVLGGEAWQRVPLGSRVRAGGLLGAADDGGLSGVLRARGSPEVLRPPGPLWRASAAVRASLRASVAHRPPAEAVLVPALVAGDDAGLDPEVEEDFRTTGLTHLTAVSGTNLTLVVGALLLAARWAGVRGRWLVVVGGLGIAGFVLVARTEPSVVRAAAMGAVALVGLASGGRRRGLRSLGVAVLVLLLVSPGLAVSVGFALSVSATAGILLLAPGWRDAAAPWSTRPLAEAVAVPAAAQLACTPLVAAISGQVSLVAVLANLLVAPAVAPATVLGLLGGLVGLVWSDGARLLGTGAAWCVGWIVAVARRGADLPGAAVAWAPSAWSLSALTALCLVIAAAAPWLLRRPRRAVPLALAGLLVVTVRLPTPGWPGEWSVAVCDVGQGDAVVLRAGAGAGVLVDAGPDSAAVDRCLDRLGVHTLPLVVLTHFHADHVDGLVGALDGRVVGQVVTSPLPEPAGGARGVAEVAAAAGAPVAPAQVGSAGVVGAVTWQVLWPTPAAVAGGEAGAEGDAANDASVVLWVEVDGLSLLLTGDVEPPAQRGLARLLAGVRVDVLKVPHHGSRHQDLELLTGLAPRLALTSVGADNDYGHPAREVLLALEAAGARTARTDVDGTLLVAVDDGEPVLRTEQ